MEPQPSHPAPPWCPPHFSDDGDEVTPPGQQEAKGLVRSWVCGNELLQEKYLDASRETHCPPPPCCLIMAAHIFSSQQAQRLAIHQLSGLSWELR